MNFDRLDGVLKRFDELTERLSDQRLLRDMNEWKKAAKERASLEPLAETYLKFKKTRGDLAEARYILDNDSDPDMLEMAKQELREKTDEEEALAAELKILLLPADPDDDKNVIMEIRAGAGGDEAALFAYQLTRMYKLYAERRGFTVKDLSISHTELSGVKEAVFEIFGKSAYSVFKFESGVHRVQRVPATETQGRVHTSTVTVAVLPEAEDVVVDINENDLKIDTYRSGGAGGQHVNKTESAIRITHIPTGIVVQCQDERSQIQNREKAMTALKAKLYERFRSAADKEYSENRKSQVGTGDRSERVRTYNFPQGRVTDHRINMTVYTIDSFMNGDIGQMQDALRIADQTARLNAAQD